VLAFTPDVERALTWFTWTHELGERGWRRSDVPDAGRGGLAKQDARLMLQLEEIRSVANELLAEEIERRRTDNDVEQWRHQRSEALR
jgi:hypothetical protein